MIPSYDFGFCYCLDVSVCVLNAYIVKALCKSGCLFVFGCVHYMPAFLRAEYLRALYRRSSSISTGWAKKTGPV